MPSSHSIQGRSISFLLDLQPGSNKWCHLWKIETKASMVSPDLAKVHLKPLICEDQICIYVCLDVFDKGKIGSQSIDP